MSDRRDASVLPVCFCSAHDGMHVHLPDMWDGQYGLPVVLSPLVQEDSAYLVSVVKGEDGKERLGVAKITSRGRG